MSIIVTMTGTATTPWMTALQKSAYRVERLSPLYAISANPNHVPKGSK
jgi:hypothetical protein